MAEASRKGIYHMAVVMLFLVTAYLLRFYPVQRELIVKGRVVFSGTFFTFVRGAIYTGIIIAWGRSVYRRMIHPQLVKLFAVISSLMILWMVVRTIKFMLPDEWADLTRICWYLYYIPMLLIPLCAFLISMWLGKPEDYSLPKWTHGLSIVGLALVLLVLSNDFHQLVFTFPGSPWGHSDMDGSYGYGVLFNLVFGWRVAGLFISVCVISARSRAPGSRRWLFLPMFLAVMLFLYGIAYTMRLPLVYLVYEDLTVTECLHVVAILESCLRCGLIRSNTHYKELFGELGYSSVIVDENYVPVYASDAFAPMPAEIMRQAENSALEMEKGLLLKSMAIRDGHILWTENVSELLELQEQAEALARELAEEQELLQAQIEMKQKQAVLDTRNKLYDSMMREISDKFVEIDKLVSGTYGSEEEKKTAMRRMCVIGAYIKRRCNLLFLNEENRNISSEELGYCLRESADYINFYGAACTLNSARFGMISTQNAKLAYDLFEEVVEAVLSSLLAMLVYLDCADGFLNLKLQAECGEQEMDFGGMEDRVLEQNGSLQSFFEDDILYVRLSLPTGGECDERV